MQQSPSSTPSLPHLHTRLDNLWTTHLNHLEAYSQAQRQLQKHLSAGFLSLARANFNAREGVRRYGRDYYHDRAVATRRVEVFVDEEGARVRVTEWTPPPLQEGGEGEGEDDVPVEKIGEEVMQQPSPPSTPDPLSRSSHNSETNNPTKPPKLPLATDPLRWYGILVPPALRSAQTSFSLGVDEAVAEAVNAARAMRGCEVEIRRLRKEIRRVERGV